MDGAPVADFRLALNQGQPIGNSRFYAEIEAMTGQQRALRKRGRPQKNEEKISLPDTGQLNGGPFTSKAFARGKRQ